MTGTVSLLFYTGGGFDSYIESVRLAEAFEKAGNNPMPGSCIGPTLEYGFSPLFSIETELLFSIEGGGYVLYSGDDRQAHLINEYNLDIPLFAKICVLRKQRHILYLKAGPQVSILLGESEIVQDGHEFDTRNNGRDNFNPVGFGILSAAGWQVKMKKHDVLLELRYCREFTESIRNTGANFQNAVSIGLGLKFGTAGEIR